MSDLVPWQLSLVEAAKLIRDGELSPSELLESVLARIDEVEQATRAYVGVDRAAARAAAAQLSEEAMKGRFRGLLHGIPLAVKDAIDVEGVPTRLGSTAYSQASPALVDANVVARLRQEGAVIVGKTVTHELACGLYSPPVRNPWSLERCCGGSSGGSAAAVAAGEALAALGSDTGGSVRIPSAFCGVVGYKPSYGSHDLSGTAPLSPSLDHLGLITRTSADMSFLLEAIGWFAPACQPSWSRPRGQELAGTRLVVPGELYDVYEDAVGEAFEEALGALRSAGAKISKVSVRSLAYASLAETAIFTAEASATYDEVLRTRPEQVGRDVRVLLQVGAVLPYGLYAKAQQLRQRIRHDLAAAVAERGTFLCSPTVPMVAYAPDEQVWGRSGGSIAEAVTSNVVPFNLSGFPAVSVPMGPDGSGLPLGLQLAGGPYTDFDLLAVAEAFEHVQRRMRRWPANLANVTAVADKTEAPRSQGLQAL